MEIIKVPILGDQLGSTSVVVDAGGAIVGTQGYYPYGETRYATGSLYTDRLSTGQQAIASLGLYNYKARYYSPYITHFIQPDTIVPDLYNPQTLNRYAYSNNNPTNYTDPSGHMATECGGQNDECQGSELENAINAQKLASLLYDPTGQQQQQNAEIAETILYDGTEIVASAVFEPADWAYTASHCAEGDCSAWVLLGVLPFIPSSATKYLDDLIESGAKFVGHHTIPKQILKMLPEDLANAVRGKKGAPNIWQIPASVHKVLHSGAGNGGAYNQAWRTASEPLLERGNITPDEIFGIRDRMVKSFGISRWRK
jgi:RHS repeat-associated protein